MTVVVDPTASGPSGITLDDLVKRVQQDLSQRENLNQLSAGIDELDTTLTLQYSLSSVTRGTELSIGDEIFYVWQADSGNRQVTVLRGYGGSTSETHVAGEIVTIGGKSRKQIIDALNDELASLSGKGIFRMSSYTLTDYNINQTAYSNPDLDDSNIYDVQFYDSLSQEWSHIPGWQFSALDSAVVLPPVWFGNEDVRVLYKTGFNRFVFGTEDVQADAGLHSEAADVLVKGAVWRLLTPDEAARNDIYSQGDTRRSDEVPAGGVLRSAQGFKQIRDERISEEKDRLRRKWPLRKTGW